MPEHLFKHTDLEPLENNPPVGKFKILVVGTFNANIDNNDATWFYGRPENEFWCLFPRMLNKPTLHPVDRDEPIEELTQLWKNFCIENEVIIVDLFKEVYINLPNHADSNLHNLFPEDCEPFDFHQAFANCTFEYVMFTWKGMEQNTLTYLKNEYIAFFEAKGSKILHLLTPSLAYSKPRNFKLNQWREEYNQQ